MKMFILTALFFSFSLNIQASVSCDEKQIKEAKRSHSEDIVGHSIKEIFLHFYQNPDALNKAPYEFLQQGELQGYSTVDNPRSKGKNSYVSNLTLAQYSQYYIDCKRNPKSTLCLNPPSYLWGGMGWYERRDEHTLMLNLHGNDPLTTKLSKSHPGLDCSGFTYAVFANAKLRVTTDLHLNPSFETADNTPARSYMALDDKSCFREIPYGKNPSAELRHGDLLVWKTHMLIIDTLGEDPFGINHISGIADCSIDKIKPEQATLTIFNSKGGFTPHQADVIKTFELNAFFNKSHKKLTSLKQKNFNTGVGVGISKQWGKEFFYTSPKIFFSLAINFCKAKFDSVKNLNDIKIIRHKAFFEDQPAPCACFARKQDDLELHP